MELHVFPFFSSRREAARLVDDADRDRSLLCRRLLIVFVENEFHSNGKGGKNAKGQIEKISGPINMTIFVVPNFSCQICLEKGRESQGKWKKSIE